MQTVSCPSCGAPVEFRSHASVMAVCEYCKSTLLKDADSVRDIGKMSAVLEDYSPIQIGTSGTFRGNQFTVIGRIQLRYADGMWNEWYLLYDNGQAGWLSDASGQYALSAQRAADGALPAFEELAPAQSHTILGQRFIVADIRAAQCIGGQGELPFKVGQGWEARVADLRSRASFITLDYSDGEMPKLYAGEAVTLEQLKCQLLRDEQQIRESAGRFRGKLAPLACPSCGTSITFLPGITRHLVCPSCRAQIDAGSDTAQVLEAGERLAAEPTTLQLGATAKIGGKAFTIIGLMKRRDDEGYGWTEYLLYNSPWGFFWLVETDEGWFRSKVLDEWPRWYGTGPAVLGDQKYQPASEYTAEVTFAAGAFNWRVKAGDTVRVKEFENGPGSLAAEMTEHEMTWSQASIVAADQIKAWFGADVKAEKKSAATSQPLGSIARWMMAILLGLNFVPLIFAFSHTWFIVLLGLAAIYLPAKFIDPESRADR